MTDEPVYEFIKGQGWVVTPENSVFICNRHVRVPFDFKVKLKEQFWKYVKLITPYRAVAELRAQSPYLCGNGCSECNRLFSQRSRELHDLLSGNFTDTELLTSIKRLWEAGS